MKDRFLNILQSLARRGAARLGRESWTVRVTRPLYESSLNFLAQDAGVPWRVNGETYRIDSRYRHMFGQEYESAVARFLRDRVQPGDVIFDVGANVGVYVLQLARWTSGHGKIVAFEPNSAARAVLERHVAMNGLQDQVLLVPSAVANETGDKVLWASGEDGMARLQEPNALLLGEASGQKVTVTTLDRFVSSSGIEPRWILMDIEGFEVNALLGARSLIQRLKGRLGFVIELHPQIWDGVGTPRGVLEELISELKLNVEPITGQKDLLGEYGHVLIS